jgi:hypothetical protein
MLRGLPLVSTRILLSAAFESLSKPIFSTAGKHLRHALEHFEALLDTAAASSSTFSYDTRKRDSTMESGIGSATEALRGVISRLDEMVPNIPIETSLMMDAVTPFEQTLPTTFGREVSKSYLVTTLTGELNGIRAALVLQSSCCSSLGHGMQSTFGLWEPLLIRIQIRVICGEMVCCVPAFQKSPY